MYRAGADTLNKRTDTQTRDAAQALTFDSVSFSYGPDRVHFNQNEDHSAKYKVNIDSATFDPVSRRVAVR